jgi:hypothetical protein
MTLSTPEVRSLTHFATFRTADGHEFHVFSGAESALTGYRVIIVVHDYTSIMKEVEGFTILYTPTPTAEIFGHLIAMHVSGLHVAGPLIRARAILSTKRHMKTMLRMGYALVVVGDLPGDR